MSDFISKRAVKEWVVKQVDDTINDRSLNIQNIASRNVILGRLEKAMDDGDFDIQHLKVVK